MPRPCWGWSSADPGPGPSAVWGRPRSTGMVASTRPSWPEAGSWWARAAPTTWPAGPRPASSSPWPARSGCPGGGSYVTSPGQRVVSVVTDKGILRRADGVLRLAAVPAGDGTIAGARPRLHASCGYEPDGGTAGGGVAGRSVPTRSGRCASSTGRGSFWHDATESNEDGRRPIFARRRPGRVNEN